MLATGKKKCDFLVSDQGHDAGGEHAGPGFVFGIFCFPVDFHYDRQNFHPCVVIVDDIPLGGLSFQFLIDRLNFVAGLFGFVPQAGNRYRNAQILLQFAKPVQGKSGATP